MYIFAVGLEEGEIEPDGPEQIEIPLREKGMGHAAVRRIFLSKLDLLEKQHFFTENEAETRSFGAGVHGQSEIDAARNGPTPIRKRT